MGAVIKQRKVCVVTASRAEYGLLHWLLRTLRDDPRIALQIIATGAHLSAAHGMTIGSILSDGFEVSERVPMPLEDDSPLGITRAMGVGTQGFAEALGRLQPDILVVLGDRYEILCAAQAAMIARIPIAHIHGGESTEGAIDEAVRHAVTKMSHLHFVAAETFRDRVIQMGEAPERVWVVGAAGLDQIENLQPIEKAQLETGLGIVLTPPCFLVTYHPVTLAQSEPALEMRTVLTTLLETAGLLIVTGTNADTHNTAIRSEAAALTARHPDKIVSVQSLGAQRYLSLIRHVDAVVGNSSSGLLEAPTMGTPSIDIGPRQQGRPRAPSVIHCECTAEAIRLAVNQALSSAHRAVAAKCQSPYGKPGAARLIAKVLTQHSLDGLLTKKFHDLPVSSPMAMGNRHD